MGKYDHFVETEKLAQLLVTDKANDQAEALLNALSEGCTGTEINMALRWNIKNILMLDFISEESRICAERLWDELYKVYNNS